MGVAEESLGILSVENNVDGAVVVPAVGLASWLAAGAFGKMEGVAKRLGPEVDRDWKGFLGAVEEAGGELLGLKSVDAVGVGTAVVSAFWAASAGFENANGDAAVKGLGPEVNIELELVEATAGAFAAVDDKGKELLDGNSGDGAVAAGAGAGPGDSVLGNTLCALGNAGEVKAKGFEVDEVDDEGAGGFVKIDACFSPAVG